MTQSCQTVLSQHKDKIEDIVDVQIEENREAIFFIFEDGSTSDIIKGGPTNISIRREQEKAILSQGNIVGSVHTHPTQIGPSTIDIMTGSATRQNNVCVASIVSEDDVDFILTCLDLSELNVMERRQLVRSMRRSSVGFTRQGRLARKELNLNRFDIDVCEVVV